MRTAFLLGGALALFGGIGAATAQPPAPEGEIYAAHGTEPFWGLTFEDGKMIWTGMEEERIEVARPRPVASRGGVHVYRTPRMTVEISHEGRCNDGMSDFEYPDTVRVRFPGAGRGRPLEGCGGGVLPPVTLADSGWAIVEIDGTQVGGEDYALQFDGAGRLSGRAGCNRFSGPYVQRGRTLTPGAIAATRMACPGDRMTHETKMLGLLRGPVQINYRSGLIMTLRGTHEGSDVYVTLRRL
ncbi:MAG TPA: META domain-containing protein [Allosphingosinicella sp.]|nr:META domain-containing protein [Allosphingosinicella sp.]